MPTEELDAMLSDGPEAVRTRNALLNAGIETAQAITKLTAEQFLMIPKVGPKSLGYLNGYLASKGLALRRENDPVGVLVDALLAAGVSEELIDGYTVAEVRRMLAAVS